ncbi:hypothetical protein INT44_001889 [Umbelopsis vinacea]|uniref:Uncharacterized protein n=1 Tax=Umbelopsis vinacea TaxID=44442 RepID=A0A8H7PRF3_9FUNG|nr:hypothetical protein INT44_001889 [Umbelopsis vinacea]KAI9277490.1 hypothetical protein BC943DRAFT_332655 [Umbelopsis sp. AD052]
MQGFTVFLAIAAAILTYSPLFSAAAPSTYTLHYITLHGQNISLPVVEEVCQNLPAETATVDNTTPLIAYVYAQPGCEGDLTGVMPGEKYDGPLKLSSVIMVDMSSFFGPGN